MYYSYLFFKPFNFLNMKKLTLKNDKIYIYIILYGSNNII